jgi:hypothetical protein
MVVPTGFSLTLRLLVIGAFLSGSVPSSMAFCYEPSYAPDPPTILPGPPESYQKPSPPYCLAGFRYSRTHTCDQWEIDRYVNDINDYIKKLNTYAEEANEFAAKAAEFAKDANSFAQSAYDYAKCEAADVKSEIE